MFDVRCMIENSSRIATQCTANQRTRRAVRPVATRLLRNGLTLIELLIVIFILVTLVAGVIPMISPNNDARKIREASRGLQTYIIAAQAEAARTGRPAGIGFEEMPNGGGMALEVYQMQVPAPYAGFAEYSRATVSQAGNQYLDTNSNGKFPQYYGENLYKVSFTERISGMAEPLPPRMFRVGDLIDAEGNLYLIVDSVSNQGKLVYSPSINDPNSDPNEGTGIWYFGDPTSSDPNAQVSDLECIWLNDDGQLPPPPDAFKRYHIYRQPIRSSTAPYMFPTGIGIDMQGSILEGGRLMPGTLLMELAGDVGPGEGLASVFQSFDTIYSITGIPDSAAIMFSATGSVDKIYFNDEEISEVSRIVLLLGQVENGGLDITSDAWHTDPNCSDEELTEKQSEVNWLSLDSQLIAIAPSSGRVVVSETAFVDSPAIRIATVTTTATCSTRTPRSKSRPPMISSTKCGAGGDDKGGCMMFDVKWMIENSSRIATQCTANERTRKKGTGTFYAKRSQSPFSAPHGISLIEVLVSMFVLLFGLMGVAALFPVGNYYAQTGENQDLGTSLAQSAFEDLHARGLLRPEKWLYADGTPFIDPNTDRFPTTDPGYAFVIDPLGAFNVAEVKFPYGARFVQSDNPKDNPWNPNPLGGPLLLGNDWPVRRMTLNVDPNSAAFAPMTGQVAETIFSLRDDLAIEEPDEDDRPVMQLWDWDQTTTPPTPLARQYKGNYTWLATVVPTSTEALAALQPDDSGYGSHLYEVSVVVFRRRDKTPSAESEMLLDAVMLTGGNEVELYIAGSTNPEDLDTAMKEIRPGMWISLMGVNQTSGLFMMKWYRLLAMDDETDISNTAGPSNGLPVRRAMLDGPEWPMANATVATDLKAAILPGVVSVTTKPEPME